MKIFHTKDSFSKFISTVKSNGKTIGFVPTMGSLHEGHLSLVSRALTDNDIAVCSIFVNPVQFNNRRDFEKYPQDLKRDLDMLEKKAVHAVFTPDTKEMFPAGEMSDRFDLGAVSGEMEGRFRPGHFQGVATIVNKLLRSAHPDRAYFGEKDYQQLLIIRELVRSENLEVEVIGCPVCREAHGLAMSSRNERLTEVQRRQASLLYESLLKAKKMVKTTPPIEVKTIIEEDFADHPEIDLEYFIIADSQTLKPVYFYSSKSMRAFIAAYIGGVRLIDNIEL